MQKFNPQKFKSLALEDARKVLFSSLTPLESELVPLASALFRVLRKDLIATNFSPSHDISTMDGYAVSQIPGKHWQIVGELPAGSPAPKLPLKNTEAMAVFTGSILPPGTFAVIPKEDCSLTSTNELTISSTPKNLQYILAKGADFTKDQILLKAPKTLTPRDISLAASLGFSHLWVGKQPRISIISTGSELVLPSNQTRTPLPSGKIYASNGYGIAALCHALGGVPLLEPPIADQTHLLKELLEKSLTHADLIVTIGGASVGKYDLVRPVLSTLGAELLFERVATRPGRPIFFALCEKMPVIGLPGNPASATVGSWLYLADMIKKLCGLQIAPALTLSLAKTKNALPANPSPFDVFYRASTIGNPIKPQISTGDPTLYLEILARQESGLNYPTAYADALILQKSYAPPSDSDSIVSYLAPPALTL